MMLLSPAAFDVLHALAYERRTSKQALPAETHNLLFTREGKPPIP